MKGIVLIVLFISATCLSSQGLTDINSWAYQLQDINIDEISSSNEFDLVVIDYSSDGTDAGKFSQSEISKIKESGKKVISYISIGEAEDYRYYWNSLWDADNDGIPDASAPSWLGNENPDWEGNYKVRFWDPDWQDIIFGYVDKIIEQGFDGIYCDIIDAYYYWAEETGDKPDADTLMMSFIFSLRQHVNQQAGDNFYIIPQNGEYIIEEVNVNDYYRTHYLNSIDAIGVEDVFFYGDADENNPFNPDNDRIRVLQDYREWGIPVLSVEYLTDQSLIDRFVVEANNNEFIPYATVRELDVFSGLPTSVAVTVSFPDRYMLYQNYPNPFSARGGSGSDGNPSTIIEYTIPNNVGVVRRLTDSPLTTVQLVVYDILGTELVTLVNKQQVPGNYKVEFNASTLGRQLPSGIYFYKLDVKSADTKLKDYSSTRKMLLIK